MGGAWYSPSMRFQTALARRAVSTEPVSAQFWKFRQSETIGE